MVSTGLSKVGYTYVNSDDCWMLAARDANGNQVANPDKVPHTGGVGDMREARSQPGAVCDV